VAKRFINIIIAVHSIFHASNCFAVNYYVAQDFLSGEVVRRGVSSDQGIAAGELILAPNTFFRVWVYDSDRKLVGDEDIRTPESGLRFSVNSVALYVTSAADSDGDGLADDVEFVLGSNPTDPDSDNDGVLDGAAIELGLDPVTGNLTGVIGSVTTAGFSQDVAARNDIAVVADGATGIKVFNVFNQMPPLIMAVVDTPGDARAVAISGNTIAVADGPNGLAVIDISEPTTASIVRQLGFGAESVAVAASAGVAYVALNNGQVAAVDLATGTVLHRITVSAGLHDVRIGGETLYALSATDLYAIPLADNSFLVSGTASAPGSGSFDRRRLFVGTDVLYATHALGYAIFDIQNPRSPVLFINQQTAQFRWKQVVANGSGLGLMAYSIVVNDPSQTVSLHNVGQNGYSNLFVTGFGAPAVAEALAIYNGQAFVAAGNAGLQVLNYLSTDTAGVPPTITLTTTATGGQIEEGQPVRMTAQVADDVQVRNVEFYVDGVKVATDGNFPFEHRFLAPRISGGGSAFSLNARVSDTGGNFAWVNPVNVVLLPDLTGPSVAGTIPAEYGLVGSPDRVTVFFNEPVAAGTVTPSSLQVVSAGADELVGSGDDAPIAGGVVSLSPDLTTAILTLPTPLVAGVYSIQVATTVTDVSGNPMFQPYRAAFRAISGTDSDGDGVPDDVELVLGLNPDNPDSDGDGISDGLEDADSDNLSNAQEIVMGTNPDLDDTDDDGTLDGDEDRDMDSISDSQEFQFGLNPFKEDSDGDGWYDEAELTAGSDGNNPNSRPGFALLARPAVRVIKPIVDLATLGTVMALPRVKALSPSTGLPPGQSLSAVLAKPAVTVLKPVIDLVSLGTVLARPRVQALNPSTGLPPGQSLSAVLAKPAVTVLRPSTDPASLGTVLALPRVTYDSRTNAP